MKRKTPPKFLAESQELFGPDKPNYALLNAQAVQVQNTPKGVVRKRSTGKGKSEPEPKPE